tara:strand:- start:12 stop:230 length:219 start_codon:yes stop_codon:yes gene_type:complete
MDGFGIKSNAGLALKSAVKASVKKIMTKKHWKDLSIGISMIGLSVFLFFNGYYTIEVAILMAILTLWWLEFF